MSRSAEPKRPEPRRPAANPPERRSIAATNGHEPVDDRHPTGDAAGRRPNARVVRVTLGPEHESAPTMIVGPDRATIDGEAIPAHLRWIAADRARLEPEGVDVQFLTPPTAGAQPPGVVRREVLLEGWRIVVEIEPAARAELRERAGRGDRAGVRGVASELHAMIPGRVLSIAVTVGDAVEAGQAVMIIEAMKMQNELRVPRAGMVSRIVVAPGETVEVGDLLIALEPLPALAPTEAAP
jgi:biotin carboxyl carrier protein